MKIEFSEEDVIWEWNFMVLLYKTSSIFHLHKKINGYEDDPWQNVLMG